MRYTLILLAGCGMSHAATDAGPTARDAGEPRPDTGPPLPDAGEWDAGAAGCTAPLIGYAEIANMPEREPDWMTVAVFADDAPDCAPETVGACNLRTCATSAGARYEAGTVEVYGALGESALEYDESQRLYYTLGRFEGWPAGGTVGVRASGAEFPAFDLAVTVPSAIELLTPPPAEIDGALEITWTPASGPEIDVHLTADAGPWIACSFPRADGAGEVPAELLSRLGAGSAHVMIASGSEAELCTPSHRVSVAAVYRAFEARLVVDVPEE